MKLWIRIGDQGSGDQGSLGAGIMKHSPRPCGLVAQTRVLPQRQTAATAFSVTCARSIRLILAESPIKPLGPWSSRRQLWYWQQALRLTLRYAHLIPIAAALARRIPRSIAHVVRAFERIMKSAVRGFMRRAPGTSAAHRLDTWCLAVAGGHHRLLAFADSRAVARPAGRR